MGGFAVRGDIYLSRRVPIAITPALGLGVGGQLFSFSSADGACDVSAGIPTVVVNVDLAARLELGGHHALYFSPANLYVITPGLTDGDPVDTSCLGGGTVTPKDLFGTDETRVNYNLDFGYMFQF
jgi:hypothetical protein